MDFFEGMDTILKTFWFIAVPSSLIFIIQTIMTFAGGWGDSDSDLGLDHILDGYEIPFQYFTLRNLINFLLGFSWTGISFYTTIPNSFLLVLLSLLVGTGFVYAFFAVIKQVQKLAEDNSFKISDTLNKTAEVYLAIPERMSGKGKVMISVNGTFHELSAMTEEKKVTSGTIVRVVRIEDDNILIVETI